MEKDDYRFSLSAEKYLDKHHVLVYIEDAISQILEHKDDNPKVNPNKFFSDYFNSVKEGNHTLFREFSFVKKTPHNRSSFVHTFWKCFRNIGRKGDLLSIREYHSLLCLLCSDFPFSPVQKTARIILMDDAMDCLIAFSDFLYAFQVQFCFEEFLSKCEDVYKELQENRPSSHDPVVVPTSEEGPPQVHQGANASLSAKPDGVDSMQYFRALIPVCEKLDFFAPPVPVLREIMNGAERVTFYGFLMALAKSDSLNSSIGKLPVKAELLEVSESELAALKSIRTPRGSKHKVKAPAATATAAAKKGGSVNGYQGEMESAAAIGENKPLPRPVTAGLATNPQPTNPTADPPKPKQKLAALKRRLARSEARNLSSSETETDDSDN